MATGWRGILGPAAIALAAQAAGADVVMLGASRDTTLYSEDAARSNGAGDYTFSGSTRDGFVRRALMAFDVQGAIPPGSTIHSATLTLYMSRTRTQDETVSLHLVVADWGEGTSHAGTRD